MLYRLILSLFVCGVVYGQQASSKLAERDPRYRLQPNDVIELQYRYTPEYNQTVAVQPDGFISVAIAGELKVEGLTIEQACAAVKDKVSARLRDPELVLVLKDFERPHFVVGGEVAKPGRFELRGRTTVLDALAQAGGLRPLSSKSTQVVLFRRVNSEVAETKILNVKEMMRPNATEDIVLAPGDMLLVPQSRLSKIERFVKWTSLGIYWTPVRM